MSIHMRMDTTMNINTPTVMGRGQRITGTSMREITALTNMTIRAMKRSPTTTLIDRDARLFTAKKGSCRQTGIKGNLPRISKEGFIQPSNGQDSSLA